MSEASAAFDFSLDDLPDEAELDREIVARGGLRDFVEIAWSQIDPAPFVPARHIDEICKHLEAVTRGEIRNLLILIPPGHSKSSLVCVLWPAWTWIKDPKRKWIFAANDGDLALRDARRVRNMIMSDWWRARWPHVRIKVGGSAAVGEYETSEMGFRLSMGIGEKVIGRHADIKVFDDPNKPPDSKQEVSKADLQKVIDSWDGTFSTRNTDVKKTATVGVMQRLHELDLAGHLMDKWKRGGVPFEVLRLPFEFESATRCVTSVGGDWRSNEGELLCPERFDQEAALLLKAELGSSRRVAAQLQQRPVPKGGNIIKATWLRHWGTCGRSCAERSCPGPVLADLPPLDEMRLEQSWDATFKGASTSDYVVGQVWAFWRQYALLLDQVRGQWGFTHTIREFRALSTKWPRAFVKRVEDKANGPALANVLQGEVPGIKLVNPEGDKETRLRACEPVYEAGLVLYPPEETHPWVAINHHEILNFPAAANDDTVDSSTQALLPLAKGNRLEQLRAFVSNFGKALAS